MRVPVDDPPLAVLHAATPAVIAVMSTKRVKTPMYTRQEYSGSFVGSLSVFPRRLFYPERPVDVGRFHEEIVGPGAFVVLSGTGTHPAGVGDDADGAAADGAAERELERAGAGRRLIGCLPDNAEPAGFAGHVAHRPSAAPRPRSDDLCDGDDWLRLGRL